MEQTTFPRVNGREFAGGMEGRNVTFIGEVIDPHSGLLRAPDGVQIRAYLPPGEQLTSKHVQIVGKIAGHNTIEAMLVKSLNTDMSLNGHEFDLALYGKTLDLINGKYKSLFD